MPLYYFDVFDGRRFWMDEFGAELKDLYEAREQAQSLLSELARGTLPDGDSYQVKVVVRCSGGRCRYEATLALQGGWVDPPEVPGGNDHSVS